MKENEVRGWTVLQKERGLGVDVGSPRVYEPKLNVGNDEMRPWEKEGRSAGQLVNGVGADVGKGRGHP